MVDSRNNAGQHNGTVVLYHALSADEVLSGLRSDRNGLSQDEAGKRLQEYGPNELEGGKKVSPLVVFLRQFLSPLIYVLLIAAIVSIAVDHYIDAAVIIGVLLLNAIIGFVQETQAERAMQALMEMASPRAKVRRDGEVMEVATRDLVPGDIVLITAGDRIPSDARLLEASNLRVAEAALTGESQPVEKSPHPVAADTLVADRCNMVYLATVATSGRSIAVVVQTGMATEMGKIATGIQEEKEEKTPVQQGIAKLSKYIIFVVLGVIGILVAVSLAKGLESIDIFLLAVAAAVSAIPEGLPAVVTVVLAIGMRTMASRNAIIRRLVAVETLGSATVICSDKTGTLTLNQMTVRQIYVDGKTIEVTGEGYRPEGEFRSEGDRVMADSHEPLGLHLRAVALCNDSQLRRNGGFSIIGDPTEGALVVAAAKAGINKPDLEKDFPRLDEIPFESERQYMGTLHPREGGGRIAYVKGSLERLLSMSGFIKTSSGVVPLDSEWSGRLQGIANEMAEQALRVIATAYMELPGGTEKLDEGRLRGDLVLLGLFGMADPPREEAKQAIALCKQAGIRVIVITGDNRLTAESIARQLELGEVKAITGRELQQMSDEELAREIDSLTVFARIEPLHKLRIVNALKQKGHTVAMTGDGVNDAPALKAANIGVAMGITGTDVAKEASDMVLADDNFASVVAAVDEGRATFNRLRNVVTYLMSTNVGELLALILCVGITGVAPLLAVQLIWVNVVTDASVAIPLGLERKTGNELKHPPRHPRVGLVFPGLMLRIAFLSAVMATGLFLVFNWAKSAMELDHARTLAFTTMVSFEWFKSFVTRSDEYTSWHLGLFSNRWLLLGISVALLLQIAAVYAPPFQTAFSTVPLELRDWGIVLAAGFGLFVIEEVRKLFWPRLFSLGKWEPVRRGLA